MLNFILKIQKSVSLIKRPWLVVAAAILLFGFLGSHTIWTQEYRWQHICQHMLDSHDYFHPYLDGRPYYDKPLLSYWLILTVAKLLGGLSNWALRLPSVIAGIITLASTYWVGKKVFDSETGHLATWLLLTTFYFIFWARVASTDMLNVMSIMLACGWFIAHHQEGKPWHVWVFLLLLAMSALLKGLIAPVLVMLVLLPLWAKKEFLQRYCNRQSFMAAVVAGVIYLLPFIISSFIGGNQYGENGLVQVFRENILRFFHPFDHQGGPLTYFIFMPVYTLPWTPLVLIALGQWLWRIKQTTSAERWSLWSVMSIFIFLSLSGSRRSYYILPIVPFAMIMAASWWQKNFAQRRYFQRTLKTAIVSFYILMFAYFVLLQPIYYTFFKHHAA